MDAASHTGVDDVREILDGVRYPPTSLKIKVYIIDEAHMLSKSAFNALLKTLEEPPPHVLFTVCRHGHQTRVWLGKQFQDITKSSHEEADSMAMDLLMRAQGICVFSAAYQDEILFETEIQKLHEWIKAL